MHTLHWKPKLRKWITELKTSQGFPLSSVWRERCHEVLKKVVYFDGIFLGFMKKTKVIKLLEGC